MYENNDEKAASAINNNVISMKSISAKKRKKMKANVNIEEKAKAKSENVKENDEESIEEIEIINVKK